MNIRPICKVSGLNCKCKIFFDKKNVQRMI